MRATAGIQPYGRDEALLEQCRETGRPALELYRPRRAEVVLGRGSKESLEVSAAACGAEGVGLRRRLGGGCAVLLDPGNLVLSVALPLEGLGKVRRAFDRITDWVIDGLAESGLKGVEKAGSSDLSLRGKKVGGSCVYRSRGFLYYSTTLVLEADLAVMERVLPHPPREPEYRDGRGHGEFLGSLAPAGEAERWLERLREVFVPERAERLARELSSLN